MITTFLGLKELRQNMAAITKKALAKNERVIVLRKNKPIFELRPLSNEDALIETFRRDIEEARNDVQHGRTKSQADVERLLGL